MSESMLLLFQLLSHAQLFCDLMDCGLPDSSVHGIFQKKYWNGLLFPSPGDLPSPGFEPTSPALSRGFFTTEPPGKPAGGCTGSKLVCCYFLYMVLQHRLRRRQWHPTPVLLLGKSHGWRSLVGCSPWGCQESDRTEQLHFSLSCIGESNGNPLQCSFLENPRDGGTWWAALYGVSQSRTRLKRLSSSSSSIDLGILSSVCI